jgi:hypothetical protein
MLLRLKQLLVGLLDVIRRCSHVHVKPLQFFALALDLDVDILGNIIDISHNILDLVDFIPSLFDYGGHVVHLGLHLQVLIVLYPELLLIGPFDLTVPLI